MINWSQVLALVRVLSKDGIFLTCFIVLISVTRKSLLCFCNILSIQWLWHSKIWLNENLTQSRSNSTSRFHEERIFLSERFSFWPLMILIGVRANVRWWAQLMQGPLIVGASSLSYTIRLMWKTRKFCEEMQPLSMSSTNLTSFMTQD